MSTEQSENIHVVTFTHKDVVRHIRAANVVGRQCDSMTTETSYWRYAGDEAGTLASQQAEARLRGDDPTITRERRARQVSSGALPEGGNAGSTSLNPAP